MSMRKFEAESLCDWLEAIFTAAGCPAGEAALIAAHLVDADMSGHPSHGIVRTARYLEWIEQGKMQAVARVSVITRSDPLALLDGHFSFGQVLGHEVVGLATEMAGQNGLAVIGLRHAGHLGRIGAWAELLADRGLISIHFVTVAGSRIVAPFGAVRPCMSTAPVTIGVPHLDARGASDHFILDFATSRVAEGKVLVALKRGGTLPADAIVDGEGRDSADPRDLYGSTADAPVPNPRMGAGALQAMGEHKGSGLGLACELLAGALTGAGTNAADHPFCNGMLSIVLDPARFAGDGGIRAEVDAFIASIRAATPRDPARPVLIPGDPERSRRRICAAEGVPLEEGLIESLRAVSSRLGVGPPPG